MACWVINIGCTNRFNSIFIYPVIFVKFTQTVLDGLHRDVTAKKKLEVDTQFLKHRVHQLGESFGQPQLLRDADLVIKHPLETGGPQDPER